MKYSLQKPLFDPDGLHPPVDIGKQADVGDRTAAAYVYTDEIILAVNVALATRRPILIRGPSGVGKSTLARDVALRLDRRLIELTITSRTQASDLLYSVDWIERLHDAQRRLPEGQKVDLALSNYVRPGPLFRAFAPQRAKEPLPHGPAVILFDEIDKAEPDVPNNLLVPLGSLKFEIPVEGVADVKASAKRAPLVFVTSNSERELPPAFLRRCIDLDIAPKTADELAKIGHSHFPKSKRRVQKLARILIPPGRELEDPPSPAEFVDLMRALITHRVPIDETNATFLAIAKTTVWKHERVLPGDPE